MKPINLLTLPHDYKQIFQIDPPYAHNADLTPPHLGSGLKGRQRISQLIVYSQNPHTSQLQQPNNKLNNESNDILTTGSREDCDCQKMYIYSF